jgi:cytochrome c oxidase cbb3-type subunit IV
METIRSLMTLAAFSSFIGIVWWAYAPARKGRFEKDGLMPFDGEDQ